MRLKLLLVEQSVFWKQLSAEQFSDAWVLFCFKLWLWDKKKTDMLRIAWHIALKRACSELCYGPKRVYTSPVTQTPNHQIIPPHLWGSHEQTFNGGLLSGTKSVRSRGVRRREASMLLLAWFCIFTVFIHICDKPRNDLFKKGCCDLLLS